MEVRLNRHNEKLVCSECLQKKYKYIGKIKGEYKFTCEHCQHENTFKAPRKQGYFSIDRVYNIVEDHYRVVEENDKACMLKEIHFSFFPMYVLINKEVPGFTRGKMISASDFGRIATCWADEKMAWKHFMRISNGAIV